MLWFFSTPSLPLESRFPAEAPGELRKLPRLPARSPAGVPGATEITQHSKGFCRGGTGAEACFPAPDPAHLTQPTFPSLLVLCLPGVSPLSHCTRSDSLQRPCQLRLVSAYKWPSLPYEAQPPRNLCTTGSNLFLPLALSTYPTISVVAKLLVHVSFLSSRTQPDITFAAHRTGTKAIFDWRAITAIWGTFVCRASH